MEIRVEHRVNHALNEAFALLRFCIVVLRKEHLVALQRLNVLFQLCFLGFIQFQLHLLRLLEMLQNKVVVFCAQATFPFCFAFQQTQTAFFRVICIFSIRERFVFLHQFLCGLTIGTAH